MVTKLHVLRNGEEDKQRWSVLSGVHECRFKRPTLSSLCSPPVIYERERERICLCEREGEFFVCKRERRKEKEGELEICFGDQELEKQKVKEN